MANTYTLIASNTLSSSAASVTFSAIPNTYTDLVLRVSARSIFNGDDAILLRLNGSSSTIYSQTELEASSTTPGSQRTTNDNYIRYSAIPSASANYTTNTFSSMEIYLPSYIASQNKPLSVFNVLENNSTTAGRWAINIEAGLFRSTSAISSIDLTTAQASSFATNSSFFLYGIKNS